jgi:hypothetical protein
MVNRSVIFIISNVWITAPFDQEFYKVKFPISLFTNNFWATIIL